MTFNLKNLTRNNVRLKIVPRPGAVITLNDDGPNPTAFIDTDGSLVGCFDKPIFTCFPTVIGSRIIRDAGISYYEDYPDMDTKWAFTAVTTAADGSTEQVTARWLRSERNYSNLDYSMVFGSKVLVDRGNGQAAHFQLRSHAMNAAGSVGDDPENWVMVTLMETPDLAPDELDFFKLLLAPRLDVDEYSLIACGTKVFPGY